MVEYLTLIEFYVSAVSAVTQRVIKAQFVQFLMKNNSPNIHRCHVLKTRNLLSSDFRGDDRGSVKLIVFIVHSAFHKHCFVA